MSQRIYCGINAHDGEYCQKSSGGDLLLDETIGTVVAMTMMNRVIKSGTKTGRMPKSETPYTEAMLKEAHKHSIAKKEEFLNSEFCGCFYCLAKYPPSEFEENNFIPEYMPMLLEDDNVTPKQKRKNRVTTWCPKCEIDSVIGSASGFPVDDQEFLNEMSGYWFL